MAKGALADLGKKLSRIFLGRIVVHQLGSLHRDEPTEVITHRRALETHPVRSHPRIGAALFVEWKSSKPKAAGMILGAHLEEHFRINDVSLEKFGKVKTSGIKTTLRARAAAHKGMIRIKRLPQTRRNRKAFLKDPPRFANSSLLAFFSPIYQDRVKGSSLDKKTGNLNLWYKENAHMGGARSHLLLFRVFGSTEPLRWVWLPADKAR